MSPYERIVRSVPVALSEARRSPMAERLPTWKPWRQFAAFILLSIALFFAVGLTMGIAAQFIPDLRAAMTGTEGPLPATPTRLIAEGVEALNVGIWLALLAATFFLAAAIAYRQPLSGFLWPRRRFDLTQFGVGLIAMIAVAVMLIPYYVWRGSEWAPPIADSLYLDWTRPAYVLLTAAGLLLAAAAEEVFCRGVMLRLTALVIRHPLILCLVNGVVFSALHLDPDPVAFLARMMSGMVWTWAALRLGGLEFAIGAHLANNLVISMLWQPISEMPQDSDAPWIALAPEIFINVVILLIIERLANRYTAGTGKDLAPGSATA